MGVSVSARVQPLFLILLFNAAGRGGLVGIRTSGLATTEMKRAVIKLAGDHCGGKN